jgi:hypothetical protein
MRGGYRLGSVPRIGRGCPPEDASGQLQRRHEGRIITIGAPPERRSAQSCRTTCHPKSQFAPLPHKPRRVADPDVPRGWRGLACELSPSTSCSAASQVRASLMKRVAIQPRLT